MSNMKKIVCLILALVMGVASLVGCGKKEEVGKVKPKEDIEIEEAIDDGIIAKGDNIEITADTYGYYLYQCALNAAMKEDPSLTDIANFDWNKVDENGVKIADTIKMNAANALIKRKVVVEYAKDEGIKFEDEERKQIETTMDEYKEKDGEEKFNTTLNALGVFSKEEYVELFGDETIYNKVKDDFDQNRDNYIKDEEEMKKYKDDDNVSVKHILIMNNSTKHEDPKAAAEEILARAKNGEDFDALVKEFNEDPGQPESGYSFGHGEMVPEFEEASFALDYDEISDIVPSSYGYHIIKRVVGRAEFENYIVAEENIEKNIEYIDSISVIDILSKISEANKILAEEQAGGEENAGK